MKKNKLPMDATAWLNIQDLILKDVRHKRVRTIRFHSQEVKKTKLTCCDSSQKRFIIAGVCYYPAGTQETLGF